MKSVKTLLILLCFSQITIAQFFDDFNDGNYTQNPTWIVTDGIFTVNSNFELHQVDTAAGSSQIYTPVAIGDTTTWEFYIRLDFSPSSSNFSKIYLSSTSSDFSNSLNGYFIKIGESGSNDALELYQQSGNNTTLLIRGTDAAISSSPAQARIKVTRSNTGDWELYADYNGGTNYNLEGTGTDNTYPQGDYFGFYNQYTSSRKDLFFFDSIAIAPLFVDVQPPSVTSVSPITPTSIDVQFSESLDQLSAENISNYNLSSIGNPTNASVDNSDPTLVHLTFTSSLQNTQTYTLTTTNIEDQAGNPMITQDLSFTFYDIQPALLWEVLITEIMADPSPPIALPNAEFIELFNNSNKTIALATLTFSNGGTPVSLPDGLLLPNEYAILCDDSDTSLFQGFGKLVVLNNMPSLVNGGDELTLADQNGNSIHQVSYTDDWYKDNDKSSGGWTLELMNPTLICRGSDNWIASNDPSGGTPGQVNSVFSNTPDITAPQLLQVTVPYADTLYLLFNENLAPTTVGTVANYNISPSIGQPIAANLLDDLLTVQLVLATPLLNQENYSINVNGISDCTGNINVNNSLNFVFVSTENPNRYDIIFNEIMADPLPSISLPEVEFIELYNRSDKAFNLENFEFSNQSNTVLLPSYILLPDEYVILYNDPTVNYGIIGNALLVPDLPTLGNTSDELTLISSEGEQIDYVAYQNSWYQNTSKDDGGWTLERIFPNQPCIVGAVNWQASNALQGGTPGYKNAIANDNFDDNFPDLVRAFPISPTLVELQFSEGLDEQTAENIENYQFEPSTSIAEASLQPPYYDKILLQLTTPLAENTIYSITVNDIDDCVGNSVALMNTTNIGLPDSIRYRDLIINEILFNPVTGGSDFIEIYNRSNKILNLNDLLIGNMGPIFPDKIEPVSVNRLIFPNEYVVFTENPIQVQQQYLSPASSQFQEFDLPSYNDDEGGVILLSQGRQIDLFFYNENQHHALLDHEDGVSLERINPEDSTLNKENWHSASATVNYATPGYQNSQFMEFTSQGNELITLPNQTFSPDDDGFEDLLFVQYEMSELGFIARIDIYDAEGRLIKNLINGELFGASGQLKWDGTTNEGTKARLGIYIIWIELTHPNGTVQRVRKACVLAGRL